MNTLEEFYLMESFDAIAYKDYLRQIKAEHFVVSYLLKSGNKILRTRIDDKELLFDHISKLSYPPAKNARTDRASLEGKSMFYGSIFTHKDGGVVLPRLINLMETSDLFKDVNSKGKQLLTQSAWVNIRNLRLAVLPISINYKEPCDELIGIQFEFQKVAVEIGMKLTNEALFLGDLFAAKNFANTYNMTAHFVDYLLNESNEKDYFDGILYPSVPSEGLGFNICIRPSLIDEGVIQFLGASSMLLIKDEMESKMSQLFDCDVVGDGDLIWHNSDMLNKALQNPCLFSSLLNL